MERTKLGIQVGLLAAIAYLLAIFGGYVALLLVVGYVLLFESNEWLKKSCLKTFLLMIFFSILLRCIGLIPDVFSWLDSLVGVFGGQFNYLGIANFIEVFTKAIEILRTVIFLLLALKALKLGTIKLPYVDSVLEKHLS